MKKTLNIIVSAILVVFLLAVFPFCLIRKTTDFSSVMTSTYNSDTDLFNNSPVTQSFICQYSYLSYIDIVLKCNNPNVLESDGSFVFVLKDRENKIIVEDTIPFSSKEDYSYRANIRKWIKKGEEYSYSFYFTDSDYDGAFSLLYTVNASDDAPGNTELLVDGYKLSGNLASVYGYGCPLNIKNMLYIDSFFILIYLAAILAINGDFKELRKIKAFEKLEKILTKTDSIIRKYKIIKIVVFVIEIIGITGMLAIISRNIAVDWDEAYSINMIRNNNLAGILKTTALDIHPPLYYFLLYFWIKIFHDSFYVYKLMSVIITVLTIIFGSYYVNKHFGFKVTFLFNLIVGLGPVFLTYALNIRMYSLGNMFVILSALMAYDIIQSRAENKKTITTWILFTLSSLGGVYSHYFTAVPYVIIFAYCIVNN